MTTNTHSIRNVAVTARWDTALDIESQLPAQEEILGAQGFRRPKQERQPPEGVFDEKPCDLQEANHALIVPRRWARARSYREAQRMEYLRSTANAASAQRPSTENASSALPGMPPKTA